MRKFFCILLILVGLTSFVYGATRQEIQVALDLVRFVNIVNDLLDNSVPVAKGEVKTFDRESDEERDMTVEEMQSAMKRVCENIYGYKRIIVAFLAISENQELAKSGLAALGIDDVKLRAEFGSMIAVTNHIYNNIDLLNGEVKLKDLGSYIESNVQKLPLVRKAK